MSQVDIDREKVEQLDSASFPEKIRIYAMLMGPAWLGIALNIGGATFVTGAVLGAATGVKFLWVVTLAVFGSWIMMMGTMKLMIVNSEPIIKTIRDHMHPIVGLLIAGATIVVNEVFHTTQMFLSAAWLSTLFGGSIELWTVATAVIVGLIVFPGQTKGYERVIENIMKVVLFLLVISLLVNLFFVDVDWGAVAAGLFVPTLPQTQSQVLQVTGVIGAGFVITVPMVSSYGWRAREWDTAFLNFGRWEVHLSQFMFLLVNWAVIIVFAFTLRQMNQVPGSPIEGALALRPLVGDFAFALYGFGLWAAVISSITMQVTITAYTVSDVLDWDLNPADNRWKLAGALTFIPGIIVPFIGVSPFQWTVFGSAFNSSFTFLFVVVLLYLLRSESVMGEYRISGRLYYGLLYSVALAAIVFARFWLSTLNIV